VMRHHILSDIAVICADVEHGAIGIKRMDSVSLISGRFLWNGKYLLVRPKGQPPVFLEQLRVELMQAAATNVGAR